MTLTLYHAWASSASRRVRLCLEEKGLEWDGHVVNLGKLEQHSDAYKKINPLGVVPTLVHDGRPLHESGTICEYLDEVFAAPPLRPAAPYDRALVRNWIRHIDGLIQNLVVFNWKHSLQKVAQTWSDEELEAHIAKIPSEVRRETWRRVARRPFTREEEDAARATLVAQLLDRMEAACADNGGWLVDGAYSIADIAAVPFIKRIDEEIAPEEMKVDRHPHVAAWWEAVTARPAYGRARLGPFVEAHDE